MLGITPRSTQHLGDAPLLSENDTYSRARARVQLRGILLAGTLLHQPRPPGLRLAQPARGGEGSALLTLLEDREEPAPRPPPRVHQRAGFPLRPPCRHAAGR